MLQKHKGEAFLGRFIYGFSAYNTDTSRARLATTPTHSSRESPMVRKALQGRLGRNDRAAAGLGSFGKCEYEVLDDDGGIVMEGIEPGDGTCDHLYTKSPENHSVTSSTIHRGTAPPYNTGDQGEPVMLEGDPDPERQQQQIPPQQQQQRSQHSAASTRSSNSHAQGTRASSAEKPRGSGGRPGSTDEERYNTISKQRIGAGSAHSSSTRGSSALSRVPPGTSLSPHNTTFQCLLLHREKLLVYFRDLVDRIDLHYMLVPPEHLPYDSSYYDSFENSAPTPWNPDPPQQVLISTTRKPPKAPPTELSVTQLLQQAKDGNEGERSKATRDTSAAVEADENHQRNHSNKAASSSATAPAANHVDSARHHSDSSTLRGRERGVEGEDDDVVCGDRAYMQMRAAEDGLRTEVANVVKALRVTTMELVRLYLLSTHPSKRGCTEDRWWAIIRKEWPYSLHSIVAPHPHAMHMIAFPVHGNLFLDASYEFAPTPSRAAQAAERVTTPNNNATNDSRMRQLLALSASPSTKPSHRHYPQRVATPLFGSQAARRRAATPNGNNNSAASQRYGLRQAANDAALIQLYLEELDL